MSEALLWGAGFVLLTVLAAGTSAAIACSKARNKDRSPASDAKAKHETIAIRGLHSEIKAHHVWGEVRDV